MDILQQHFYDLHRLAHDAVIELTRLHLGAACRAGKDAYAELASVFWQLILHEVELLADPVLQAYAEDLTSSRPLNLTFDNFAAFFNHLPNDPADIEAQRFALLGKLRRADRHMRLLWPDLPLPALPESFAATYSVSPTDSFTAPRSVVHRKDNRFWFEAAYQPGADPQYTLPLTVDDILTKADQPAWASVVHQGQVLRKFSVA